MAPSRAERDLHRHVERTADLGSQDKTARLWDISTVPPGSLFDIACAWLPDHDLERLGEAYNLDLSREPPICQKDASGKFTTPLPDPATAKWELARP